MGEPAALPRQPWRSLRVRALFVVVVVLLLPVALVGGSTVFERNVGARMRGRVAEAALQTEAVLRDVSARGQSAKVREQRLDDVAATWGSRLHVVGPGGDPRLLFDHEASGLSRLGALFFFPDGAPTLAQLEDALPPLEERPEGKAALSATASTMSAPSVECRKTDDNLLLVCAATHVVDVGGTRWLVSAQESSRREVRALYDLRYQLLKLTLLTLPAALLLAWWLGWRMVRPVERLRAQVLDKVARAAPEADLDLRRRDEIGELALAFNALLGKVDERGRATEAFVAELAHELKNPVAAVRAVGDALTSGRVDEERSRRLAAALHDSSRRLDALVTQVLEIARAEAGLEGEARETLDLRALVEGIVEHTSGDERYGEVSFEVRADGGVRVQGVPHRLESAVRNLVDNAASFASAGGHVRVRVVRGDSHAIVEVSDDGPGIAPEDLPRVFDRFFTTRGSRQGTGLGLALVRAIALAHGGSVEATLSEGEGATFRLRLPVA